MNRRGFFSRLLGAACLAVAERVLPSSLAPLAAPTVESEPECSLGLLSWDADRVLSFEFVGVYGQSPSAAALVDIEAMRKRWQEINDYLTPD